MSFLGIFSLKKDKLEPLYDLSGIGVDIHSHLLPGLDDGVKTMTEATQAVRELHQLGYKKLILTPHVMTDYYKNTSETILMGVASLEKALSDLKIPMKLEAGAEYYADFDFSKKIGKEKLLTFGDNYILIEFSYFNPPQGVEDLIFKLRTQGYKPILAHPERYIYWHGNFNYYNELKNREVLFQVNINSLTGEYTQPVKKIAEKFISEGMIDFAGTDAHNVRHVEMMRTALTNKHLQELITSGNLKNLMI